MRQVIESRIIAHAHRNSEPLNTARQPFDRLPSYRRSARRIFRPARHLGGSGAPALVFAVCGRVRFSVGLFADSCVRSRHRIRYRHRANHDRRVDFSRVPARAVSVFVGVGAAGDGCGGDWLGGDWQIARVRLGRLAQPFQHRRSDRDRQLALSVVGFWESELVASATFGLAWISSVYSVVLFFHSNTFSAITTRVEFRLGKTTLGKGHRSQYVVLGT